MSDLFDRADFEERAAIIEYDGLLSREKAESLARHECEVRWCITQFYPDGWKMKAHFAEVEKVRGKKATDMLRDDVRVMWAAKSASKTHQNALSGDQKK